MTAAIWALMIAAYFAAVTLCDYLAWRLDQRQVRRRVVERARWGAHAIDE